MVFLRPTVIRDNAGLAAISGKKYSDIRILGGEDSENIPRILPRSADQLFDGQGGAAIDLRQP